MTLRSLAVLLAIVFLHISCSSTSNDSSISGMDGDAEADLPTIDGDMDGAQSDGDSETTTCVNGQIGCEDASLTVCRDGEWRAVADCAENGWNCEAGRCVANETETETEEAYRTRLNELRIKNAGLTVQLDPYGGWMNAPESFGEPDPGEYFRVKKIDGRWWFITPDGYPLVSKGVTDVNYLGSNLRDDEYHQILVDKYGDEEAWIDASLDRLHDWKFNTIGPWSSRSIVDRNTHAEPILNSGMWAPRYNPEDPVADYWSQGFEDHAYSVAVNGAAPLAEDKNLLGFFLDNELVWGPDWRTDKTLIQLYVDFPVDAPGRVEVLLFVKEAAVDLDTFNATWGTTLASWDDLPGLISDNFEPETAEAESVTEEFMVHTFHRYATIAVAGLRAAETNHLILGCRFAWYPGDNMVKAAAQHFDVISMAGYQENWVDELDALWPELEKPILIEEFSFRAKDSGLLNFMDDFVSKTQKDRALAYDAYVESFMRRPYAVAYHWYKWFDNPSDGFFDGHNVGLMNNLDEPYADFVTFIREVNLQVETWHAEGLPGDGKEDQE